MPNDECRVSDGRTGRLVVEEDVLVFPLVGKSGQILSGCVDVSTIIAALKEVVKCLGKIVGVCLERSVIEAMARKSYDCG